MSFSKLLFALILLLPCVCFAAEYDMSAVMLEDEQAFYITQSTAYTNTSGVHLDCVLFSVYSNCFRRETALPYDNSTLAAAFPSGYAPGGTEFSAIYVDGAAASWGIQGETELFLRVDCDLAPDESCVFSFEYTLLLSENSAFLGCGEYDWRLVGFYPAVCATESGEFVTNPLSRAAKSFYSESSSFRMALYLPEGYELACGGDVQSIPGGYTITLENANELAFCVSKRFHSYTSGSITLYGQNRGELKRLLERAEDCAAVYADLFGALPCEGLAIVVSQSATTLISPGLIILSDTDVLERAIAAQYFTAADPCTDPFLCDGLAEYMSLLYIEEAEGETAFKKRLNSEILPALSVTIPGSLTPDSYLSSFTTVSDYDTVVIRRGAAVFHELRTLMGRESFITALRAYIQGGDRGIQAFVSRFEESSGRSIGNALVAWLYTIDEYVNADMEYYE